MTAHVAAGVFVLAPWLIRNVIISGYVVYPYAGIDLFHPDWKMDAAVLYEDSLDIKMFARGLRSAAEYDNSLTGWVPGWFLSQNMGNRIVLLAGVICIPVLLYLLVRSFRKREYALTALISAGLVNLAFWFFSAPHMRYGGPYIYILVVMTLGTLAGSGRMGFSGAGIKLLRIAAVAVLLFYALPYGWKVTEIPQMEAKAFIRQPDYLAWPATQYPVENVHIWMPDEGDLIGYFAFPATSQKKQLETLVLRGESFKEGFQHE